MVTAEELAAVGRDLGLEALPAAWIGGNLVLSGIPHLSLLPPRTLLMFASDATIRVDGDNGPCRIAGRAIAGHAGREALEFEFAKVAHKRRGLVGWVERPGSIKAGEAVTARVWEQCIYPPPKFPAALERTENCVAF